MAGTEPAVEFALLAGRYAAEMRADADDDEPLRLLDAFGVRLRIGQLRQRNVFRRFDFGWRAVTHENRLAAPFHRDDLAFRNRRKIDFGRGQRQSGRVRIYSRNQRPRHAGDGSRSCGARRDIENVAPARLRRFDGGVFACHARTSPNALKSSRPRRRLRPRRPFYANSLRRCPQAAIGKIGYFLGRTRARLRSRRYAANSTVSTTERAHGSSYACFVPARHSTERRDHAANLRLPWRRCGDYRTCRFSHKRPRLPARRHGLSRSRDD